MTEETVLKAPTRAQTPQPLRRARSEGLPDAGKPKTPGAPTTAKRSSEIISSTSIRLATTSSKPNADPNVASFSDVITDGGDDSKHVRFQDTVIIKEPIHLTAANPASLSANFSDGVESVDGDSEDERMDKIAPLPSVRASRRPSSARAARSRSSNGTRRRHSAKLASAPGGSIQRPNNLRNGKKSSSSATTKRRASVSVPRTRTSRAGSSANKSNKLRVPKSPLAPGAPRSPRTPKSPKSPKSPQTPQTPETPGEAGIVASPRIDRSRAGSDASSRRRHSSHTTRDIDNEALIARLRRDMQELKKKVKKRDTELSEMRLERLKSEREKDKLSLQAVASHNGMSSEALEKQCKQLKKEVKDLKHERDLLRQQSKEGEIKLAAAMEKLHAYNNGKSGNEDVLLAQLQRMKRDAKTARKEKKELREQTIKLQNIDANLRAKLSKLTRKLMDLDGGGEMAQRVADAGDVEKMIFVLVEQLHEMTGKYEMLLKEYEVMSKQAARGKELETKVEDLEVVVKAKEQINEGLKIKLRETEEMYEEHKKLKRDLENKQEEFEMMKQDHERLVMEMAREQEKSKNFEHQVKIISQMPAANNWNKQVSRLKKIFARLDVNKDGKLDFEEFACGATELGFGSLEEEQRSSFRAMDSNSDGLVEYSDFENACMQIIHNKEGSSASDWSSVRALLTKPPVLWNFEDVSKWLSYIGMDSYCHNFENEFMDGEKLLQLARRAPDTKSLAFELEHLGITKSRHVRKFAKELSDVIRRDDVISNMQCENEKLREEINDLKDQLEFGPSWQNVKTLQTRVRGLESQLRHERAVREQVMFEIKDALRNDPRFDSLDVNEEDLVAELALLKGALADSNYRLQKMKARMKQNISGQTDGNGSNDGLEGFEAQGKQLHQIGFKTGDKDDSDGVKPIGRMVQKWYVLANHGTQYWVSRTNRELMIQEERWRAEKSKNGLDGMNEEEAAKQGKSLDQTEALNWILYDAKKERLVNEVRMKGRGEKNDPKQVKIQMSVKQEGPWTTVKDAELKRVKNEQVVGGFRASSRYWRVCFMTNHGEADLDAPRFCMYEVQFWGPLDETGNDNFLIE